MDFQCDLLKFVIERLNSLLCVYFDHTRETYSWERVKIKEWYKLISPLSVKKKKIKLSLPNQPKYCDPKIT